MAEPARRVPQQYPAREGRGDGARRPSWFEEDAGAAAEENEAPAEASERPAAGSRLTTLLQAWPIVTAGLVLVLGVLMIGLAARQLRTWSVGAPFESELHVYLGIFLLAGGLLTGIAAAGAHAGKAWGMGALVSLLTLVAATFSLGWATAGVYHESCMPSGCEATPAIPAPAPAAPGRP